MSAAIKASYFDRTGQITQGTFKPYLRNGEPVTAVNDSDAIASSNVVNALVTHKAYDDAIAAYKRLSQASQKIYREEAAAFVKGTLKQQSTNPDFLRDLDQAGLSRSASTRAIIDDYDTGGERRREAVYEVGGSPVAESAITPAVLSFKMGIMDYYAAMRLEGKLQYSEPLLPGFPSRQSPKPPAYTR